jgi:peroxiredoxin Q/BCP
MPLPTPGTTPPPFTLPNQDGEAVSLSDHAGRHVLVWFYSRAFGSN